LVDNGWYASVTAVYEIIGTPCPGGILLIGDHASNRIPAGLGLSLSQDLLEQHIAWDLGVAQVARRLADQNDICVMLSTVSRLVVDLNRYDYDEDVVPKFSDGHILTGNDIGKKELAQRLAVFYHPYHRKLSDLIAKMKPSLLVALHSFSPQLSDKPLEKRPWEIGVMYNEDTRAARIALANLRTTNLNIGDQFPYSGKVLNATMNVHAEANNIPYVGIEMRQDMVADNNGQNIYASILAKMCNKIIEEFGRPT
jgi:predicted N-formylglutamate amidohydrolase